MLHYFDMIDFDEYTNMAPEIRHYFHWTNIGNLDACLRPNRPSLERTSINCLSFKNQKPEKSLEEYAY